MSLLHFCLTQLIDIVNCVWIAEIFQVKFVWWQFVWATTHIPSQHLHRPSYMQKAKSKFSPMKNPGDIRLYNSLSNVAIPWAIYMPCINRIDCAGHYQLEMVFVCVCLPCLQWVAHCTDLTTFSCFCSEIKKLSS